MAEILSPGVFVEEVPSQVQVIQPVSTSNVGVVGFTKSGPTDKATLVTSYEQFQRIFGGLTKDSFVPHSMAAFFANGGRRAFMTRVVPADAVSADCDIQSKTTDQLIETGDGTIVAFTKTSSTSVLKDNAGVSPLVSGSVSIRWRALGTPVVAGVLRNRANSADLVGDGALTKFEGRINPSAIPAYDAGLHAVAPAETMTLTWSIAGPTVKTLTLLAPSGALTATGSNADGSATLDMRTGRISILTAAAALASPAFTLDFTPATVTKTITDSAGTLVGAALTGPGTIGYADGAYSFTTNAGDKPHNFGKVLATYKITAWDLNPISKGKWGNNLKVSVSGNLDSLTPSTGQYTNFNVAVQVKNDAGVYETAELYEELVFNDTASINFFPDVINELSDLITVTEPAGNEAPGELQGIASTFVPAGGDESTAGKTLSFTLPNVPVATRSVTITYTDASSVVRTITDDGVGRLTGHVDTAGVNTIVYTTGVVNVTTLNTIKANTLVSVAYVAAPLETAHVEIFGDTTKSYTVGTDGTFDSTNYGRNQISSSALLSADFKGVFALNKVEELMQVIVPDFAGDITITKDLLDYAESRTSQPSGGDRFVILTTPKGNSPQEAVDWFRYQVNQYSKYAALYWPWVKVSDPLSNNRPLTIPPLGHVAGVYARTDTRRNVGKSPGGTVDGALRYLIELEREATQGERDYVYPSRINPLISSPQTGLAVWGVRTISNESEWRYINARRLFMFLEKSIFNATHWIVFENNGPALWSRIKSQLVGFLTALFNEGYFAGASPSQAFFVIVDESNNTPESIELGQVIIDVGIAPNKPAEFVRFRFTQKTQE